MVDTKQHDSTSAEAQAAQQKLQAACKEARDLLASAETAGIHPRYRAAMIIRDVMETGSYGEGAVRHMQKSLGFDRKSLYRFAGVAKAWTQSEFETMRNRKTKSGEPLHWSAWTLLAAVESPELRDRLTERAFNEALTIRQLRTALKPEVQPAPPVHKAVANMRKRAAILAEDCKFWGEQVLPLVGESKAELTVADLLELRGHAEYLGRVSAYLASMAPKLMAALNNGLPAVAPAQTMPTATQSNNQAAAN